MHAAIANAAGLLLLLFACSCVVQIVTSCVVCAAAAAATFCASGIWRGLFQGRSRKSSCLQEISKACAQAGTRSLPVPQMVPSGIAAACILCYTCLFAPVVCVSLSVIVAVCLNIVTSQVADSVVHVCVYTYCMMVSFKSVQLCVLLLS